MRPPILFRGLDAVPKAIGEWAGPHNRPIRAPHHTTPLESIVGRLAWDAAVPCHTYHSGELALANGGLLLLADITEFKRSVLTMIAGCMDTETVSIVLPNLHFRQPLAFTCYATTNNCSCGRVLDTCVCSDALKERFVSKLEWATDLFGMREWDEEEDYR